MNAILLVKLVLNILVNVLVVNHVVEIFSTLNVLISVQLEPMPSMELVNIVPITVNLVLEATLLVLLVLKEKSYTMELVMINVPMS